MHIFTVKDLFDTIKITLEDSFPFIMVKGAISKINYSSTGHLFFELKDREASIACVCWKDKLSKLKTTPAENKEVTIKGYITTFKNGTKLYLIIIDIEVHGVAELLAAIELRKNKLEALGYFAASSKQALPLYPSKIAVITSNTGAVIEDIKSRISERFPTKLVIYNSVMQGEKLVAEVIKGINYFNNLPKNEQPPVIIIARGGGSFEDLYYFNDELLVTAVFNSRIPIISAVGHETDTTLIDYAADVRASTPTAAAELATPKLKKDLTANLLLLNNSLTNNALKKVQVWDSKTKILQQLLPNINTFFSYKAANLHNYNNILAIIFPKIINQHTAVLQKLEQQLTTSANNIIQLNQLKFSQLQNTLPAVQNSLLNKQQLYLRTFRQLNYAVANFINNKYNSVNTLHFSLPSPLHLINTNSLKLNFLTQNLNQNIATSLNNSAKNCLHLQEILNSLSYEATLKRGFTLISNTKEQLIKRAKNFNPKENFTITFYDDVVKFNNKKPN